MEYQGYIPKVEYDESVGLLHASVINSGAYPIANCEARGLSPAGVGPGHGRTSVRTRPTKPQLLPY